MANLERSRPVSLGKALGVSLGAGLVPRLKQALVLAQQKDHPILSASLPPMKDTP